MKARSIKSSFLLTTCKGSIHLNLQTSDFQDPPPLNVYLKLYFIVDSSLKEIVIFLVSILCKFHVSYHFQNTLL